MHEGKKRVVIIGARGEQPAIQKQLEGLVDVVGTEDEAGRGMALLREHDPDVVLLFLDHDLPNVLALAERASVASDYVSVIISRHRNHDDILEAMRAGARDFAFLDDESQDVKRALQELLFRQQEVEATHNGKVVSLFSCKGGAGATTIALNLAGALLEAAGGKDVGKVCILDFDLEMGDVLVFLDMSSKYNFNELLTNMHRLDAELLYKSAALHSSGMYVISETDQLETAPQLRSEDYGRIISFLRGHFDFIVIDGLRDFRDMSLAALDKSDHILLTMTQDIPALKNANRCLRIFRRLGYSEDKVKLLLNRYRKGGQLTPDAVGDALGRKVAATIANDFPTVIKSVNEGRLLWEVAAKSRVASDMRGLVNLVHEAGLDQPRRSLFPLGRWGRG